MRAKAPATLPPNDNLPEATVMTRAALRVMTPPAWVRSLVPEKVKFPRISMGLCIVEVTSASRKVPAEIANLPIPKASLVPADKVPAVKLICPEKLELAPDKTKVLAPDFEMVAAPVSADSIEAIAVAPLASTVIGVALRVPPMTLELTLRVPEMERPEAKLFVPETRSRTGLDEVVPSSLTAPERTPLEPRLRVPSLIVVRPL